MTQSEKINHHHGTVVREQWPVGTFVKFKPKGLIDGEQLIGMVINHIYVNVLVISTYNNTWQVSTFRCEKIELCPSLCKQVFLTETCVNPKLCENQGFCSRCD